jgi:hypothetical protein
MALDEPAVETNNMNGIKNEVVSTETTSATAAIKPVSASTVPSGPSVSSDTNIIDRSAMPFVTVLQHGLRRKESAWSVQSWIVLALTLDGRDKLTKTLQYTCRLLAYMLTTTRFDALQASFTNARKAYRMGKALIEFHRLRSVLNALKCQLQMQLHALLVRYSSKAQQVQQVNDVDDAIISEISIISKIMNRFYQFACSKLLTLTVNVTSTIPSEPTVPSSATATPLYVLVGSALKLLCLAGFWTGDNVNFLTASGLLDDTSLPPNERASQRKQLTTQAAMFANRSYFVGALASLYASARAYIEFTATKQKDNDHEQQADDKNTALELDKQVTLFVALLKSVVDVLVFSNNPGIDIWKNYRGAKMHEGFHCLCGLLSASTVLYTNFPNATTNG